jgi:hypothetical protein
MKFPDAGQQRTLPSSSQTRPAWKPHAADDPPSRPAETDAEFEARHSRLSNHELGRADAKAVADAN